MRAQNFAGSFGGGGGQNVFSSTSQQRDDPFAGGTPAPKPNIARRLGTSFAGGIANPALRAAGTDPSFSSINLPRVAQDQFKKIGERAANQDIDNFNAQVTAENNTATAAKQAEIDAYNQQVSSLDSAKDSINNVNRLADDVNRLAGIYRTTGSTAAKNEYQDALSKYQNAKGETSNLDVFDGQNLFDDGGQRIQYGQLKGGTISGPNRSTSSDYQFGNKSGAISHTYVSSNSPLFDVWRNLGISTPSRTGGGSGPYGIGYVGQAVYNPWSGEVFNRYASDAQGKDAANVPYAFGQFDGTADQFSWYSVPDAPDPFVELKQTKNRLDDPVDRRLSGSQREIVGGDLPPQEATTSGETFSEFDVPFREAGELNAAERQRLGQPKAYRFASGFNAAPGQNVSFGGQTFSPNDITNSTSDHYFIRNFGWVAKNQLTPLY